MDSTDLHAVGYELARYLNGALEFHDNKRESFDGMGAHMTLESALRRLGTSEVGAVRDGMSLFASEIC